MLFVHSTDDERMPFGDSEQIVAQCRRAQLFAVAVLTHRRTARDAAVIARVADFVSP
jgi:hypothetical protein